MDTTREVEAVVLRYRSLPSSHPPLRSLLSLQSPSFLHGQSCESLASCCKNTVFQAIVLYLIGLRSRPRPSGSPLVNEEFQRGDAKPFSWRRLRSDLHVVIFILHPARLLQNLNCSFTSCYHWFPPSSNPKRSVNRASL